MAQDNKHDKHGDLQQEDLDDASLQLKKRARRRLIGAAALAMFAAIVLPMVMDHQPAPPLKDIQVRIPSPDEGGTQRIATPAETVTREAAKPIAPSRPEPEPVQKPESLTPAKAEVRPGTKPEPKPKATPAAIAQAQAALAGKEAAEAWEVQLGAYREPGRVKLLVGKLKELGIPTYTEKVDTPNGPRTRVRAGPYPTQEAAEKARERVKIVGVDGPVAKKP